MERVRGWASRARCGRIFGRLRFDRQSASAEPGERVMTDSPVKHDRIFLDRVLEDIQDLLEYAAERTDLSKIDDTLLCDAAEVLRPGAERGPGFAAAALGVLERLTTAVGPA